MAGAPPADVRLDAYRDRWSRKPVLRAIYGDFYDRIVGRSRRGRTLEIGGGSGNLKSHLPHVVSTDLLPAAWLDAVADAQMLPFTSDTFDNIVLVDVLHHIERPSAFFSEATRVLRPGGRVIMIEPSITACSYAVYRWLHPEPVRMRDDPYHPTVRSNGAKDPFDSNQAIPTLIFGRGRAEFARRHPELEVTERSHLSLWAYPLSGGFKERSLLPLRLVAPLLRLERRVEKVLGRWLGFREFVVLTKRSAAA